MQNTSGRSALLAWRRCAMALRGGSSRSNNNCASAIRLAKVHQQQARRTFSGTSSVCARAAAATSTEPKHAIDTSSSVTPSSGDASDSESSSLARLEKSIALRDPLQALLHFDALQVPPSPVIAQRLAILLAKKGTEAAQIARAKQVLKDVYMCVDALVNDELLCNQQLSD